MAPRTDPTALRQPEIKFANLIIAQFPDDFSPYLDIADAFSLSLEDAAEHWEKLISQFDDEREFLKLNLSEYQVLHCVFDHLPTKFEPNAVYPEEAALAKFPNYELVHAAFPTVQVPGVADRLRNVRSRMARLKKKVADAVATLTEKGDESGIGGPVGIGTENRPEKDHFGNVIDYENTMVHGFGHPFGPFRGPIC